MEKTIIENNIQSRGYNLASYSTPPEEFNWKTKHTKRECDGKIIQFFKDYLLDQEHQNPVRVLSFPAGDWMWEDRVQYEFDHLNIHFTGVERDPYVYRKAAKSASKIKNGQLFNTDVAQVLNQTKKPWNIAYLDYMGTWSREKVAHMYALAQKDLCDVLIITIALCRGRPETMDSVFNLLRRSNTPKFFETIDNDTRIIIQEESMSDAKIRGVPLHIHNIFREFGIFMRLHGGFVYESYPEDNPNRVQGEVTFCMKKVKNFR